MKNAKDTPDAKPADVKEEIVEVGRNGASVDRDGVCAQGEHTRVGEWLVSHVALNELRSSTPALALISCAPFPHLLAPRQDDGELEGDDAEDLDSRQGSEL